MNRAFAFAALTLAAALPSSAYYHFIHYLPAGNAPEKFDLAALPHNTVTFFYSETGPSAYSATDSFNSVINQIRQAAAAWNNVASSSLRVAFGGAENSATIQNAPGADVVFTELPPGVEGLAGPTSLASPKTNSDGTQFYPIVRSTMYLASDLTNAPGPSFSQAFFMTTLHEMGHALGLQHTFTSSTMSQATTRATTVAHALDTDDIAGISVLYPAAGFSSQFGAISGRVTAGSQAVHLASVVALQAGTGAVSAVTDPDGTFTILGVPAGAWQVYVHSMPPDADIFGPWNGAGKEVAASPAAVNTMFYAGSVTVTAGNTASGVNISTSARSSVPFYEGQIYGYFNNDTAETYPAPVQIVQPPSEATVVASVVGLGSSGSVPGLSIQFPGNEIALDPRSGVGVDPFAENGYTYEELNFLFNSNAQPGPQHVIFSTPQYTYVLPSGMYFTLTGPPSITAASPDPDGTVTVTGANFVSGTQIYFDSLPSTVNSMDTINGVAVVSPPAGANGQTATLTAYNPDGQNSSILQAASPVTYSYGALAAPSIGAIAPQSVPAGATAVIDITGSNFSFAPRATTVGFGTSDISVQKVFVLAPNHLQADIAVSANAALSASDVSVVSGFQTATVQGGFQISASIPGLPAAFPALFNADPLLIGAWPGAIATIYGTNLAVPQGTPTVTIGNLSASLLYSSASQINLIIPPGVPPGPQTMTVFNGATIGWPVTVNIDSPPPAINGVQTAAGAYVTAGRSAGPGQTLTVSLANFAPSDAGIAPSQVQISLGGATYTASSVQSSGSLWLVTFQIGQSAPTGPQQELVVYYCGRSSLPAFISVGD